MIPDILLMVYVAAFYTFPSVHIFLRVAKIIAEIVMHKRDKLAQGKRDVFLTRKLEKCQSEESSRMIPSKFLGENLTLVQSWTSKYQKAFLLML